MPKLFDCYSILCIERLITDFVMDETRPGVQDQDTSCGEVYMAVDAFCHPGSGELDGSIRGRFGVGGGGCRVLPTLVSSQLFQPPLTFLQPLCTFLTTSHKI